MAWSDSTVSARRFGLDDYEFRFVQERAEKGQPASAIAKMLGRPVGVVLPFMPKVELSANVILPEAPKPKVMAPPPKVWRPSFPTAVRKVLSAVAAKHDLKVSDILSEKQNRNISRARQEAMWELHQLGKYSLPMIGRYLGRDHSSVHHGIAAHATRSGCPQPVRKPGGNPWRSHLTAGDEASEVVL